MNFCLSRLWHTKKTHLLHGVRLFSTCSPTKLNLTGVYPPLTTPFDENEDIYYDGLKKNLEAYDKIPFKGYVIQGSTGEFAFLTPEERVNVVKFVRENTPKSKLIIAGSGCESTRATIEMTNRMADVGADLCLVVTPSYYKGAMNDAALFIHYTKVADSSKVPILLYSVPMNTNLDLSVEVSVRLSSHPNIIGMKESGGDVAKIGNIVHQTVKNNFQVLAGSGGFFLPALTVGCVGGVFASANIIGASLCKLQDIACQPDKQLEAMHLQHRIIQPNAAVTKRFGISGLKKAMEWFNLYGGPTRSPIQNITKENELLLKECLEKNQFL